MITTRTKKVTETTWIADDGIAFSTRLEALAHEAEQRIQHLPVQTVKLDRDVNEVRVVRRFATPAEWDAWVYFRFVYRHCTPEHPPVSPFTFPAIRIIALEDGSTWRAISPTEWLTTERQTLATVATAVAALTKKED